MQSILVSQACPVTPGDINIYHARAIADQQIAYVLQFSSTLDLDRLNRALAVLARELPLLSAVVRAESGRFHRVPLAGYCPRACLDERTGPLDKAIARFTGAPCDPEREAPLKLLVARRSGQDTLCLKADHVATDAGGLKSLLYALASAYAKGNIGAAFNPDRGTGQVFRRFSPLTLLRTAFSARLPRPERGLMAGPFAVQPTFVEHLTIDQEACRSLRQEARQAGATVNDVLLAALYRVIWQRRETSQSGPFPLMVPVDMRRYLPQDRQRVAANLSSAVYTSLAAVAGESFSGTLQRVAASMQEFKQGNPGLASLILLRLGALQGGKRMKVQYQMAAAHHASFISLTNFGVVDEEPCDFGVPLAQVYGVGPIQFAPGILIAATTYAGTLHLTLQGNDTQRFQPFAHGFLESVRGELGAWRPSGN